MQYLLGLQPLAANLTQVMVSGLQGTMLQVNHSSPHDDDGELETNSVTIVDDLVVVVIQKREPFDAYFSVDRSTGSAVTNDIIRKVYDQSIGKYKDDGETQLQQQMEAEKARFLQHPYSYTKICCDVFFKFVFEGVETIREFDTPIQIAWANNSDNAGLGDSVQVTNQSVVEQMKRHAELAMLLAYMLQFGDDAKDRYEEYKAEWISIRNESDDKKAESNYWHVIYNCNYNLWGEYISGIGFHRGIDTLSLINTDVHAVCSGRIVEAAFHYISIYNYYLDVTITYMHLKHDKTALYRASKESEKAKGVAYAVYTALRDNPKISAEDLKTLHEKHSGALVEIQDIHGMTGKEYEELLRGFEVLYIHREKKHNENLKKLDVKAGELLGMQSGRGGSGTEDEFPKHTHFEINKGIYIKDDAYNNGNGHNRPYCETTLPLDAFGEGRLFSLNPSKYIERIWNGRFHNPVQSIIDIVYHEIPLTGDGG